ncbi:hypothetical protein ACFYXH_10730 [Streptomyces sp. NPDC002730]|uniref:hypothetical protein n=1 Tax=Streptomyces sp. NPDC002730 TaxID=3364662 RepID=UPI0036B6A938
MLETTIGAAGLVVAVVAAILAWSPQRLASREHSVATFLRIRRHVKSRRAELAEQCIEQQAEYRADDSLALLTKPGWIPMQPLPLDAVKLTLREALPQEQLHQARADLRRYWPREASKGRLETYAAAVEALDRPGTWFNGPSYRLLEVTPPPTDSPDAGPCLTFALGHYFDGLDTTEALAYEEALLDLRGIDDPLHGRYRRSLGGPFRLGGRAALPGVSALTVRTEGDDAFFFMHRRDGDGVAVAMDTTHVVPAGEFQPHVNVLPVWQSDLDLWRTTMREYAEEFLGAPDATGDGGVTLDYAHDAPYADFERALRDGKVRVRFLGLGMDPLTWKPEICLACVWDAEVFDRIFASMGQRNEEGTLVVGSRARSGYRGIRFTEENVLGYASHKETLPAGRACLALAWRWRRELGLSGSDR